MDITTIIFDCFGVLYPIYVDIYFEKHAEIFKDKKEILDSLNTQIDLGQIDQREFYDQLEKISGIPSDDIKAEMEQNLVADKQLIRLLQKLSKKYRLGLLSNAGHEEIGVISRDGLDSLFDSVTVSYEVGDVKPNPKIFTTILERLDSTPAESIFIDDSISNLGGAKNVGLGVIHYPKFGIIPEELILLADKI